MPEKLLNECPDLSPFQPPLNIDTPLPNCKEIPCDMDHSQKEVPFFEDITKEKKGIGQSALCDPMQTGQISQDFNNPSPNTIYRYSKAIRGCDEAMIDLFRNVIVKDEQGVEHPVPVIWGSHERAVDFVVQENVRKDNSLVVDRVRLPLISIYSSGFADNPKRYTYHQAINYFRKNGKPGLRIKEQTESDTVFGLARGLPIDITYTLTAWTYFIEDMNQILEQIRLKFSSIAYIRIQGVQWETIVRLDSISSNLDMEPGVANRVIKLQVGMTAETYIPQPIRRDKTVLKTKVEFVNGLTDEEITEVMSRLENTIEEV